MKRNVLQKDMHQLVKIVTVRDRGRLGHYRHPYNNETLVPNILQKVCRSWLLKHVVVRSDRTSLRVFSH